MQKPTTDMTTLNKRLGITITENKLKVILILLRQCVQMILQLRAR